jgi:hypothetical protein
LGGKLVTLLKCHDRTAAHHARRPTLVGRSDEDSRPVRRLLLPAYKCDHVRPSDCRGRPDVRAHNTSPCVRASTGEGFLPIGKQVKSNLERKAALDRIVRDYNHDDEPEIISWDGQGLQQYLPEPRSVALASPTSLEPLPAASPRAVADMTRDLTKMFSRVLTKISPDQARWW